MRVEIAGESLELLAERAVYWPREQTLFVADLHLGKGASFRAGGVPIPDGSSAGDLARLTGVIEQTSARRLVILGDCFHARSSFSEETVALCRDWRARHEALELELVLGNHDRRAGGLPFDWSCTIRDEGMRLGPFWLCHHPQTRAIGYVLAGHVHPSVHLRARGWPVEKLPCFVFGPQCATLPAFCSFSGKPRWHPGVDERIYAIAGDEVIALT